MTGKKKWLRSLRRIVLGVAAGLVLMLVCGIGCADKLIFMPPGVSAAQRAAWPDTLAGDGFEVAVAVRMAADADAPVLLYSHGNAEDLFDLDGLLDYYAANGFSIVAYDYEGYGASSGTPSEERCYRDIELVYEYMTGELGIPSRDIFLYGRSVGSGPTCYLATRKPAAGVILEAPFKSAFRVVLPIPLPFDRFPNHRRIGEISAPILILCGTRDQVIPTSHSESLAAGAVSSCRLEWIEGAGHNDILRTAGERYWQILRQFCSSNR